ncbi:MAG TPA: hypothetical protein VGH38_22820 [Bryobacteraceae bacterium]
MSDVTIGFMKEDRRPAFVLEDVQGIEFPSHKGAESDRRTHVRETR